jgi:hypothetical protein
MMNCFYMHCDMGISLPRFGCEASKKLLRVQKVLKTHLKKHQNYFFSNIFQYFVSHCPKYTKFCDPKSIMADFRF